MHKVILIVTVLGLAVALLSLGGLCETQQPECTVTVNPGESIQAAIDNASDGAVICLAEGTWEENVKIEKSLTLRGVQDKTTINGKEAGYPVVWITSPEEATQTVSVSVEGLKITGAQGKCADSDKGICAYGMLIQGTPQVTISNSTISQNRHAGIKLSDLTRTTIIGCAISENGVGIRLSDSAQATITGCIISDNQYGVKLDNSSQATITSCTISGDVWHGIELDDSSQATITDCTISDNKENGIALSGSAQAKIQGNVICGNTRYGIYVFSSGEVHGEENKMSGNGVDLYGNISGTLRLRLIEANEQEIVYPNPRYSSLQEAVDALLPGGRLILQAGEYEVGVTIADEVRIEADPGAEVILMAKSSCVPTLSLVGEAQARLVGLRVIGGRYGILLQANAQATITNCTISENVDGIELDDSSQATITDCTISDNKENGIALSGSAQAKIQGNVICGNTGYGIYSFSSGEVCGKGNEMRGNGVDLYGNVPGTLRLRLIEATEQESVYPNPRYSSLQEAVDALFPGGRLILQAGEYEAGVTIADEIRIEADPGAEVILTEGLSLVGGARVKLRGLKLSGGYEGILLGANAQAEITGCAIFENVRGILLLGSAQATITACAICENQWGVWLSASARAEISDCIISANYSGILLKGSTQAAITGCAIFGNRKEGILLLDSAQVEITECAIFQNKEYGIALQQRPCFDTDSIFTGQVTGSDNIIPGPDEPDGNQLGALCPEYPSDPWPEGFLIEP